MPAPTPIRSWPPKLVEIANGIEPESGTFVKFTQAGSDLFA
jgi:hypothetical protein